MILFLAFSCNCLGRLVIIYLIFVGINVLDVFLLDLSVFSLPFGGGERTHGHADGTSHDFRRHIHQGHGLKILLDLVHHRQAEILVGVLTATELENDL